MRVVAALGGNALLERGETPDAEIQQRHVELAVEALAPLCRSHDVVVTHGNGPQVGLLALESEADTSLSHGYPLDALGAQTQGMIGYWLAQALRNAVGREFVALVCQTVVSAADPSFADPSKFVGQVYDRARAEGLAQRFGWHVRADGAAWRRVVPSPRPERIVELAVIRALLERGVGVVCAGGGGIPVLCDEHGRLRGVEAVVDKDRTAALLAERLGADVLLLLTDVAAVQVGFGTPAARPLAASTVDELRRLQLPAGSMGPKVEAACAFVEATGGRAAIGRLRDAIGLLDGTAGTTICGRAHEEALLAQG
ncbi:MAG TPA: carbamate kinase [Acidimicrobiales bacterium]|nr:carbamate kinase [Acidimicrobiales bacterium]